MYFDEAAGTVDQVAFDLIMASGRRRTSTSRRGRSPERQCGWWPERRGPRECLHGPQRWRRVDLLYGEGNSDWFLSSTWRIKYSRAERHHQPLTCKFGRGEFTLVDVNDPATTCDSRVARHPRAERLVAALERSTSGRARRGGAAHGRRHARRPATWRCWPSWPRRSATRAGGGAELLRGARERVAGPRRPVRRRLPDGVSVLRALAADR